MLHDQPVSGGEGGAVWRLSEGPLGQREGQGKQWREGTASRQGLDGPQPLWDPSVKPGADCGKSVDMTSLPHSEKTNFQSRCS